LTASRKTTPELEEAFLTERRLIVNHSHYGTGNRKSNQVDVAHLVKKRQQKFTTKQSTAKFWTLEQICDAKAPDVDFANDKARRIYVEQKLGYEIIDCGDGIEGVAVKDESVKPDIIVGVSEIAIQDKVKELDNSAEGTTGSRSCHIVIYMYIIYVIVSIYYV
jgi:hypothetical protein